MLFILKLKKKKHLVSKCACVVLPMCTSPTPQEVHTRVHAIQNRCVALYLSRDKTKSMCLVGVCGRRSAR